MQRRVLGKTGLELPILSFGASSLGAEFRSVQLDEVFKSVQVALDLGLNFIDTSPYYGRGMSEVLLGIALQGVPRDEYLLCTKLGRYDAAHFDFSAKRVVESVDVSLHRLRTDHLDIVLCHDIEFVPLDQIIQETIPMLRKLQTAGKVRFVGVSGYPMKIFEVMNASTDLDCVLSYNHYTLQNTRLVDDALPHLKAKNVGVMNAGPFAARLLTHAPLPVWNRDPEPVKVAAHEAAEFCKKNGVDIAKLALQFSCSHPELSTTIAGSANPANIRKWAEWLQDPYENELIQELLKIFDPVHNVSHREGLPENN
jgi:aryl-alcohol dehydrogenase-like predicted oxidoreductase